MFAHLLFSFLKKMLVLTTISKRKKVSKINQGGIQMDALNIALPILD